MYVTIGMIIMTDHTHESKSFLLFMGRCCNIPVGGIKIIDKFI